MMNIWNVLNRVSERPERRAERLIRSALRGWNIPICEPEPGMWAVVALPKDTYRTKVFLWAQGELVRCVATSDICVDRGLLRRELLLQLLEANRPEEPGVFALVPQFEDRFVALAHVADPRSTTPVELRRTVERMMERFQGMVTRLYSMELIITGPEPFKAGPPACPHVGKPAWRR
jgi:hypothetical protein